MGNRFIGVGEVDIARRRKNFMLNAYGNISLGSFGEGDGMVVSYYRRLGGHWNMNGGRSAVCRAEIEFSSFSLLLSSERTMGRSDKKVCRIMFKRFVWLVLWGNVKP